MNVLRIPVSSVVVGERLRPVDQDHARLLAASFEACGQRTPIEVRPADKNGRHRLVVGAHRHRVVFLAERKRLYEKMHP